MEFILLCALMFRIASFGFVLPLINDWELAMQVNICQSFFANPLQQPFPQTFLLPKFFYCMIPIFLFLYDSELCVVLQKCL